MVRGIAAVARGFLRELPHGRNVIAELVRTNRLLHVGNRSCARITGALGSSGPPSHYVTTLWSYTHQLAGAVPSGGAVLVHDRVAEIVRGDLNYLARLGLGGRGVTVIPVRGDSSVPLINLALENSESIRRRLRPLNLAYLFPFMGSHHANQLAGRLHLRTSPRNAEAVHWANNKGSFLEGLARRGVSVPYGHWAQGNGDKARRLFLNVLARSGGEGGVVVKLSCGVTGLGINPGVRSLEEFRHLLATDRRYLDQLNSPRFGLRLEEAVPSDHWYNVMFWVGRRPHEDRLLFTSRQLLTRHSPHDPIPFAHTGNIGPLEPALKNKLVKEAVGATDYLREIGFKEGLAGMDMVVDPQTGRALVVDPNSRSNGHNVAAMMVHGLRRGIRPPVWGAHNGIRVPEGTGREAFVGHLEGQGIHYDRHSGRGVFVVNSATGAHGKMQVGLGAGTVQEAERWLKMAAMVGACLVFGDVIGLADLFLSNDQAA